MSPIQHDESDKYIADVQARMRADLERLERIRRGEPLTPEEEQRIRMQARREAMEARIRREEMARADGFPYYPLWLLPAMAVFTGILVILAIALVVLSLHR